MKILVVLFGLCSLALAAPAKVVKVYTYDSLASKHSFGRWMAAELEKDHGIKTEFVVFSTMTEAINQIRLEKEKTKAQILFGFDQIHATAVAEIATLETLPKSLHQKIDPKLSFGSDKMIAFDFGYLAFVYDSNRTKAPTQPVAMADWIRSPDLKKNVIIEDPRTSSLGQGLVAWVGQIKDESLAPFWKAFHPAVLTVAPGWSSAYGAFLKGECDYVLSYTTSPAYHRAEEKKDFYRSLTFKEGHWMQVEGVTLLAPRSSSADHDSAIKWIEFLLSEKVQTSLPTRQWMYPAVSGTKLPDSFNDLAQVAPVVMDRKQHAAKSAQWQKIWLEQFSQKP